MFSFLAISATALVFAPSLAAQDVERGVYFELERRLSQCVSGPGGYFNCEVRDARDDLHSATEPTIGDAGRPAETATPESVCTPRPPTFDASAVCAQGGGGGDGRTYYKGNENYDCEVQRGGVSSTNHRYPRVTYNSMRLCGPHGGRGFVYALRDENSGDHDTFAEGEGPKDTLVHRSYSARVRKSVCSNDLTPDSSQNVRCAYDWT